MCNCRKNQTAKARTYPASNGTTQTFALVDRDGSKTEFGSRLEADAANARAGYTGIVKPVSA